MKKFFAIPLLILLVMGFLLAGCAGPAPTTPPPTTPAPTTPPPTKEVFELKLNMVIPETHSRWQLAIKPWCDELEQRSGGTVKITPYFMGSLTPANEVYNSVTSGLADIGEGSVTMMPGMFPVLERCNIAQTWSVFVGNTAAMWTELYQSSPVLQEELKDIKIILFNGNVAHAFGTTSKPLNTLADLNGLQMNLTGSPEYMDKCKALGISPVTIPPEDQYDALSKGVVDGSWCNGTVLYGRRLGDLVKHVLANVCSLRNPLEFYMNWDTFNGLPKDVQDIINDMSGPAYIKLFNDAWLNGEVNDMNKAVSEMGVTLYKFSEEDLAELDRIVGALADEQIAALDAKGMPIKAVAEEFRKLEAKYAAPWPY